MPRSDALTRSSRAITFLCAVVVIAALYFSRLILLPFALAILLSFLLAPFVTRLEGARVPRVAAVLLVVLFSFTFLAFIGFAAIQQLYNLAALLPEYKTNLIHKTQVFRIDGGGVLAKLQEALSEVAESVPAKADEQTTASAKIAGAAPKPRTRDRESPDLADQTQPVRVEIVDRLSFNTMTRQFLAQILGPLGTTALVVVFVIFMLLEREDLRNRLIYLIGSRQLNLTTQALDDAGGRVSRYLLMQLIINAAFGLSIAASLFFIGIPNALLWGVMAGLLRFVPFIGPWIAAIIVLALSLAIFDDWTRPILVLALFLLFEIVAGNVLEPWLYGASTGISKIGVLVSAVFWTWLWGPVGLVVATPLTVCLTVVARHVPQMSFFNKLISTQEILPPGERFYQRLLALDAEEALDVVEEYLKDYPAESIYDAVLLPALSLAEQDRHAGDLDETRQRLVMDTVQDVIDDLALRGKGIDVAGGAEAIAPAPAAAPSEPKAPLLCLPAHDEADELAGTMLAQLLEARGVRLRVIPWETLAGEMLAEVGKQGSGMVCISALPPHAAMHARYLCKRLRPKFPMLRIVVGLWQANSSARKAQERLAATGVDKLFVTLAEAADQIAQQAGSVPPGA